MKKVKKDKLVAVWACDFCGKEFGTKKESDRHEKICKNRDNEIIINWNKVIIGLLIIGFVLFFLARSNNETIVQVEPTPTPDPDPYIMCSWDNAKNGDILCPDKRIRKSECEDSVCCNLGNGTWSSMSKVECARLQAEINSKKPVYIQQPSNRINCTTNTIGNYTYTNCY
jgi:hypothetical protein